MERDGQMQKGCARACLLLQLFVYSTLAYVAMYVVRLSLLPAAAAAAAAARDSWSSRSRLRWWRRPDFSKPGVITPLNRSFLGNVASTQN